MAENGTKIAAYVPYGTLKNALDRLKEAIPNRIDRSAFPGLAGGTQTQVVASLKFLGLIDEDGVPTPRLKPLVELDELKRKEPLRKILEERYADLFALGLANVTPAQLSETMADSYGVTGSTLRKALRFFIAAANDTGVQLSPLLVGKKGRPVIAAGNGSRRRRATPKPKQAVPAGARGGGSAPSGTAKTVRLQSGGTLTLTATLDLFRLSAADRTFVFKLIDELEKYEAEWTPPDEEEEEQDEQEG